MDLIIKCTGMCNFNCSFCSSGNSIISLEKFKKVPNQIIEVIKTIKPSMIIASGGEPLMLEPEYYYHLHEIAPDTRISITSNLKNFYINPEKWFPLLKENWIGLITSFHYGDTRKWDFRTVYDENMFIKVYNKYKEYVNRDLSFISVINFDNEHTVIDLCKLAKRLGTQVKINNSLAIGIQETSYPRYKLFQHYINIIESGYAEYEYYCSTKKLNECPFNQEFNCKNNIRVVYVDNKDKLHYYHCDDMITFNEKQLDFKNDFKQGPIYPLIKDHINENCWKCELFKLCNGCMSQVKHYPKEHCQEMLKIKDKLIEYKWIDGGLI